MILRYYSNRCNDVSSSNTDAKSSRYVMNRKILFKEATLLQCSFLCESNCAQVWEMLMLPNVIFEFYTEGHGIHIIY